MTLTSGLVTKIERLDPATQRRQEVSAEEYASITQSQYALYYAAYYAGIRDYEQAISSGNTQAAQAYHQGMAEFLGMMGQL